jgi:hypothetical protein
MKHTIAMALAFMMGTAALASAGKPASDDEAIRASIQAIDEGNDPSLTDDPILFSGVNDKPLVGKEVEKFHATEGKKLKEERKNLKRETKVRRLVIAQSGDIAYEFSDFTMSWDSADKGHVTINGSIMRAWKKTKHTNDWQLDMTFARPYGTGDKK